MPTIELSLVCHDVHAHRARSAHPAVLDAGSRDVSLGMLRQAAETQPSSSLSTTIGDLEQTRELFEQVVAAPAYSSQNVHVTRAL